MRKTKEEKIKYYSYLYNFDKNFVEEYLKEFEETDHILSEIYKNIKAMKKEYNIKKYDKKIMFENKKTKKSYFIEIEF